MRPTGITSTLRRSIYNFPKDEFQRVILNRTKSIVFSVKSSLPRVLCLLPNHSSYLKMTVKATHNTATHYRSLLTPDLVRQSHRLTLNIYRYIYQPSLFQCTIKNKVQWETFPTLPQRNTRRKQDGLIHGKCIKDLSRSDLTSRALYRVTFASVKMMMGWVLRTFKTREGMPLTTIVKALDFPDRNTRVC